MTTPNDPVYMTTAEVAARFRTSPSTVRQWRHAGYGPVGTRFGKRVLYTVDAVDEWERSVHVAEHGAVRDAGGPGGLRLASRSNSA